MDSAFTIIYAQTSSPLFNSLINLCLASQAPYSTDGDGNPLL